MVAGNRGMSPLSPNNLNGCVMEMRDINQEKRTDCRVEGQDFVGVSPTAACLNSGVDQMVDHLTLDQGVEGSNPSSASKPRREEMKKVEAVFQIMFVMDDGAELPWRIFKNLDHYRAFVGSVTRAEMRKFGIESISYRVRHIE